MFSFKVINYFTNMVFDVNGNRLFVLLLDINPKPLNQFLILRGTWMDSTYNFQFDILIFLLSHITDNFCATQDVLYV